MLKAASHDLESTKTEPGMIVEMIAFERPLGFRECHQWLPAPFARYGDKGQDQCSHREKTRGSDGKRTSLERLERNSALCERQVLTQLKRAKFWSKGIECRLAHHT
jgi:hypothetical protein